MTISPEHLELTQAIIALVLLGLSLVSLPIAYLTAWRALSGDHRRWTMAAVGVGALLRWVLAPSLLAMIFIGYKQTDHALTLLPLTHYGVGATALYHTLFGLLPAPDHQTMVHINAFIGVASLPLFGALAARLLRDPRAGVVTVWLVALTPLFIRNDVSEANIVPTLWWLAGGLVLLDAWVTSQRHTLLVAALPLLALAAIARPEMPLMLAWLIPLCGVAAGWPIARFRRPWAALCGAVVLVALATPHMVHTVNAVGVLEGRASLPGLALDEVLRLPRMLFWDRNVILRPDLFPLGITLLAGVGIVLARRTWAAMLALVCIVLLALVLYVVDLDEANIARVQVPGALFATMLAALGISRLWSVGARAGTLAIVCLAVAVLSGAPTASSLWAPANEHTEEALIQRVTEQLPATAPFTLVRLGESDRRSRGQDSRFTHYHFPDYLFRAPRRDGVVRAVRDFVDEPGLSVPTFFFHGMRCYAEFRSRDVPAPEGDDLHSACAQMHASFVLEPVFEEHVPNYGDVWIRYYGTAPAFRVGLYRVTERR